MTRRLNAMFIPLMASRLMLSLKKAAVQLNKPWSLETMTNISQGRPTEGRTSYSAQWVHGGSREISRTPAVLNDEDIEFNAVSRLP